MFPKSWPVIFSIGIDSVWASNSDQFLPENVPVRLKKMITGRLAVDMSQSDRPIPCIKPTNNQCKTVCVIHT